MAFKLNKEQVKQLSQKLNKLILFLDTDNPFAISSCISINMFSDKVTIRGLSQYFDVEFTLNSPVTYNLVNIFDSCAVDSMYFTKLISLLAKDKTIELVNFTIESPFLNVEAFDAEGYMLSKTGFEIISEDNFTRVWTPIELPPQIYTREKFERGIQHSVGTFSLLEAQYKLSKDKKSTDSIVNNIISIDKDRISSYNRSKGIYMLANNNTIPIEGDEKLIIQSKFVEALHFYNEENTKLTIYEDGNIGLLTREGDWEFFISHIVPNTDFAIDALLTIEEQVKDKVSLVEVYKLQQAINRVGSIDDNSGYVTITVKDNRLKIENFSIVEFIPFEVKTACKFSITRTTLSSVLSNCVGDNITIGFTDVCVVIESDGLTTFIEAGVEML